MRAEMIIFEQVWGGMILHQAIRYDTIQYIIRLNTLRYDMIRHGMNRSYAPVRLVKLLNQSKSKSDTDTDTDTNTDSTSDSYA